MSPTQITEIVLPARVEPEGLQIRQRTLPAPAAGQIVVQVEATGISFAEQAMRRGRYPGQPAFPFVPGYDLVGTVCGIGPGVENELLGLRVAAVTKVGGWSTHVLLSVDDVIAIPPALDPALVETVLVNGVTAWQMLHREARMQPDQTILVHGANGGVGIVLCQLAVHAGIHVIGTAAPRHHARLRAMGVRPIDYNIPDLAASVRTLAPEGVDACFDHLGLESARISFSLLAKGGVLIAYGNAAVLNGNESMIVIFLRLVSHLALWSALPNGRRATFYNFWSGSRLRPHVFRQRLRQDLAALLDLLLQGAIAPPIAARFPLVEAATAMRLAESRTVQGKIVLIP